MLNNKIGRLVVAVLALLGSLNAFAFDKREDALKNFLIEFQKGGYSQAVDAFKNLSPADKNHPSVMYWTGVAEFKLQNFDLAAKKLTLVVIQDKKGEYKDAAYLLGQSYYATQDFRKAHIAFQKSAAKKYKTGPSLYYMGYIENMLNEDNKAVATLEKVLSLGSEDSEMKQPAQFQIGEIYFERGQKMSQKTGDQKEKARVYFENAVIPKYEKTIALDEKSALANQARGRIGEIRARFGMKQNENEEHEYKEVPKTVTGSARPAKAWVLRFSQDLKYDTNIVNQPDGKLIKVSFTGSTLSKSAVFAKYEFIPTEALAITPEVAADLTYHFRRVSEVYSNDNSSVTPAIRSRYDHTFANKPAAGLFEYEFATATRDYTSQKKMFLLYTQSHNFMVGERFEVLPFGQTTIKGSVKLSRNSNPRLNFIAPKASVSQNWKLFEYILDTGFSYEYQRSKDEYYDQRSYALNSSYSVPKLFWETNLDLSLAVTLIDTMHQFDTRGLEKSFSPGFTLTRYLDSESHLSLNLNYTYTRNISNDKATYDYSKHVVGVGFQATL